VVVHMNATTSLAKRRRTSTTAAPLLALAATLSVAAPLAAQRPGFTIAQALSAPFASDLVAASGGQGVAWIFDDQGRRNIWVAQPPDYHAHRVTPYDRDDGQEITSPQWMPDGKALVYARGGDEDANWTASHYPNPDLVVGGVEQDIWVVSADGGAPRKLDEGDAPAASPRGDLVAYVKHGQIWGIGLDGAAKPRQLLHEPMGPAEELTWSPDGTRLAFVSARGDHAFIGVLDVTDSTLRYMAPSVDRDVAPAWSPDGRQIAFIRIPTRSRVNIFGARREGRPWSIWVADAATGQGHEVWHAADGPGSVLASFADRPLLWAAGDRLVFLWEKTGWLHLYSVPVAGGRAVELTPGDGIVEDVSMSADGRTVYYSSNIGDIDRRHLWSVSTAGGRPTELTRGDGLEWAPVPAGGSALALLHSDVRRPSRPAMLQAGTPHDLAPDAIPADFPASHMVTPQQVIFSSTDGLEIHGQLFLPPGTKPGEKRPAVIFLHGGSRRQMLLGWHYMEYYSNMYAMNQYLANEGYLVLAINYRSGIGYGLDFREPLHYGATGASEFNDVEAAGLYLRSRTDVDGKRIGLYGGSYGGYLTAMGLARASDLFAAGVDWAGVHDWNLEFKALVPGWDIAKDLEARRLAFQSSPMSSVDTWRSPVLLVQGDDDRNVDFSQTVQLTEDLRNQGVHVEDLIFPDEIHDFLLHRHWVEAYQATGEFLGRYLGNGAPTPH
jgi:dipeptidyl aminopeptidase/acylaminoacyl peptidase